MHIQVACMLCSIDPGTANLLLPVAQATIISAPFLLRDQIRRGIRTVRDRRRSDVPDQERSDPAETPADAPAPAAEPPEQ
jgi:hypothetical protein